MVAVSFKKPIHQVRDKLRAGRGFVFIDIPRRHHELAGYSSQSNVREVERIKFTAFEGFEHINQTKEADVLLETRHRCNDGGSKARKGRRFEGAPSLPVIHTGSQDGEYLPGYIWRDL